MSVGRRVVTLLAVLIALSACTSRPAPAPRASPSGTTSATTAATASTDEAFAIWPEDTPAAAAAAAVRLARGEDPWRSDPAETALAFADRVLGWRGAAARPPRDLGGGLLDVRVAREAGGPSVDVRVARLVFGRWWSVFGVHGSAEYDPSMEVRGRWAVVGLRDERAASEIVTIGYGGREVTRTIEGSGVVRIELGFRPDTPGHFLILLKDARGRVFDAFGSPLPAGRFAAS